MNTAQMKMAPVQRPITTSKMASRNWVVSLLFLRGCKLASQKLKVQSSNLQLPIYLGMSRRAA